MCHILLALPALALPVFWIWPPEIAGPVYGVAAVVSLGVYAVVYQAWKAPLVHGPQTLVGRTGTVVNLGDREVTLRIGGELWLAEVKGPPLGLGEEAQVVAIEGLRLTATRQDAASSRGP